MTSHDPTHDNLPIPSETASSEPAATPDTTPAPAEENTSNAAEPQAETNTAATEDSANPSEDTPSENESAPEKPSKPKKKRQAPGPRPISSIPDKNLHHVAWLKRQEAILHTVPKLVHYDRATLIDSGDDFIHVPLLALQRAVGTLRGTLVALDPETRRGTISIDGHEHTIFERNLFSSKKYPVPQEKLDALIGQEHNFKLWPTWRGRSIPRKATTSEQLRPPRLEVALIHDSDRDATPGTIEVGGQLLFIEKKYFGIRLWSFQQMRPYFVIFEGSYPHRKHLKQHVWIEGHFDPESGTYKADAIHPIEFTGARVREGTCNPLSVLFQDIDVLHNDDALMIVNKPAGVVVHRNMDQSFGTLVQMVQYQQAIRGKAKHPETKEPFLFQSAHRIDRYTSGALAISKTPDSLTHLSKLFQEHDIQRSYLALVRTSNLTEDSGTFDTLHNRDRSAGLYNYTSQTEEGKRAVTHWTVLERFEGGLGLVRCTLETGRTHQIRVHLSEHGAPMVGDRRYGQDLAEHELMDRQALHAETLGFVHPNGETIHVTCPLPEDFQNALNILRARTKAAQEAAE